MKIPYLLTTLIAHILVLDLDNRRTIKINDLINFRHLLLKKYEDNVKIEKHYGFAPINDIMEIKKLLKEYPEIFYLKEKVQGL